MDENLASNIPVDLFFLFYFFVILSALSIIITYKYLIRSMLNKENVHDALFIIIMTLICGADIPSLLGLIFGIVGMIEYDMIYWQISLPLILFGFGHSLFLHVFKIQPYLRTLEEL